MSNAATGHPEFDAPAAQRAQDMGHAYFRQLDGLRTLCVIFTVFAHIPGTPWFIAGGVGVDIFFPLSGYLITSLLHREQALKGRICLSCFYIRRIFRILPLYYLTIILYLALAVTSYVATGAEPPLDNVLSVLPWLLAFCSELRPIMLGGTFYHAWTLGIEEKYYILWPLIVFAITRIATMREARWPILLLLALALSALCYPAPNLFRGYAGLMAGSLLAFATADPALPVRRLILRWPTHVWVAGMLAGYAMVLFGGDRHWNLLVALPAAPFIAAIHLKADDLYKRFLSSPGLWHLGILTYSLYLTHRLALNVVEVVMHRLHLQSWILEFAAGYPAAVALAYILHRLVEQPFIRIGKSLSDRYAHRQPAAVAHD